MKILAIIEFSPGTGPKKRSSFSNGMAQFGFTRLPGVSSCWIADRAFNAVHPAREAIAEISLATEVSVHKAYIVDYSEFATFPAASSRRGIG